jgi:hypothetical protein
VGGVVQSGEGSIEKAGDVEIGFKDSQSSLWYNQTVFPIRDERTAPCSVRPVCVGRSDFGYGLSKSTRHGDASCLICILSALQIAST